ncbi:MAG TPA: hypothetical protein VKO63_04165 [Chitinispirillaceae bacterium]|nr:hypothetical protein [Chitinispirillaceae bacterium]
MYKLIILIMLIVATANSSEYQQCLERIHHSRDSLSNVLNNVTNDSIVKSAQKLLLRFIDDEIFPYWYYTPWNFYGTTRVPKSGNIACGYFVTTVLQDVGFDIPRVKWAQLASEGIIKKFCREIKRFHDRPVSEVIDYIKKKPDAVYVVGLDCHVGFIVKYQEKIQFVHSNYYHPEIGVMSEYLDTENPLRDSKYRVIGTVTDSVNVLRWITKTTVR